MTQIQGVTRLRSWNRAHRCIALALLLCVQVDAVPPGRLLWQLTWDQVLSVELAYHRQQTGAPPDGIIVHRKYRSEDTDVLVHDVRCNPNNNQVQCGTYSRGQL